MTILSEVLSAVSLSESVNFGIYGPQLPSGFFIIRIEGQLIGQAPHVQMLCPHSSRPGFESNLCPFSACLPSLSALSCHNL